MQTMLDTIDQIIRLSEKEKANIGVYFKLLKLKKGEVWIKEYSIAKQIAFLSSGKLRIYYHDDEGNEITCFFATPGNFITSFSSFLTATPTVENIAAIEDSALWVITQNDLAQLSDEVPKIQIVRRVIAENLFMMMEKRVAMLQSQTANERYEKMLAENPDIILSVPLQYTASFLGITPQHLSRLRKDSLNR